MSERWAACLAHAGLEPLGGSALRLVESQEQIATVRLVGSLAEQAVLEDLLEASKPRLPRPATDLHYLLATPFRYPPLKYGSRFGRRTEPSLFYASRELSAVLAEAAYYRFVFWSGMQTAPTTPLTTQHSLFSTKITTARGLRLQRPPFAQHQTLLAHRSEYTATQALGTLMREAGVEAFEFVSARDPDAASISRCSRRMRSRLANPSSCNRGCAKPTAGPCATTHAQERAWEFGVDTLRSTVACRRRPFFERHGSRIVNAAVSTIAANCHGDRSRGDWRRAGVRTALPCDRTGADRRRATTAPRGVATLHGSR